MYAVKLLRTRNERDEEYGRILLNGETIIFQGLSSVFQAELQQGIQDTQQGIVTPKDGLSFLKNLQRHYFGAGLRATDVEEISDSMPDGDITIN